MDDDGRLVVFELKRGTLNREAVAQVIDYASFLEVMPDEELASYISERSGTHGIEQIDDFAEWYDAKSQGQGLSAAKPVRMVLVGLGVDETTNRMARFLASGGMDFSLLTFHGYAYDGKTLLARQVQVEAELEPVEIKQSRPRLGRRRRRELLDNRIQEHTKQWPEAQDLWDAVLAMFRENFHDPVEVAGMGNSDWASHRLRLRMPGGGPAKAAIQLGPFGSHSELVSAIFFPNAVELCLEEFTQLRREIPYSTWPLNNLRSKEGVIEIQFPMKSLEEWEKRKNRLAEVTRSVYEAHFASEDEE